MSKIAVLIPCYNEELTIDKVITDFKNELPHADIYVMVDGDDTYPAEFVHQLISVVENMEHIKKKIKDNFTNLEITLLERL